MAGSSFEATCPPSACQLTSPPQLPSEDRGWEAEQGRCCSPAAGRMERGFPKQPLGSSSPFPLWLAVAEQRAKIFLWLWQIARQLLAQRMSGLEMRRGSAGYGVNLHCVLEVLKSWEQDRAGSGQQGVLTLVAGVGHTPREEGFLFKRSFLTCATRGCSQQPYTSHLPDGILSHLMAVFPLKHNRRL